jgi:hypothetical protein
MTYRDDHDAALARAESLEKELAETERERDRLRAELEAARQTPPPPPPQPAPRAMAATRPSPLDKHEIDDLCGTLELGVRTTGRNSAASAFISMLLFSVVSVVAFIGNEMGAGILCMGVAVVMLCALVFGRSRFEPEAWQPVIEAIRTHPRRIVSVRALSGKRRGLEIRAIDGSLVLYTRDSAGLIARLARRCPDATFENR